MHLCLSQLCNARYFTFIVLLLFGLSGCLYDEKPAIKIGILHSLTGTMAISEKPVVDAIQLAIAEINASGGVLGRQLEAVIFDGESDWNKFAEGAEILINQEKVSVIFGCWTSASRKRVKPIVEKYDHILFYPTQYEGLEQSTNIIYAGASPNQQIIPAVKWSTDTFGKRVFLAASDYIFPRAANLQIKHQLAALGAEVVGESYLPLGSLQVTELINDIHTSHADVILNTINGDSNLAFFKALHADNNKIPVMSFSIAEEDLQHIDPLIMKGHYAAWSYFQSLPSAENQQFIKHFKQRFGSHRVTSATMEAAYSGLYLWAKAVKSANTTDPSTIRLSLKGQRFQSPEGNIIMSALNNHLWKPLYIGQIQTDGQFKIIWHHSQLIRPLPFPTYRSKNQWELYLNRLYQQWDKNWSAPNLTLKSL